MPPVDNKRGGSMSIGHKQDYCDLIILRMVSTNTEVFLHGL